MKKVKKTKDLGIKILTNDPSYTEEFTKIEKDKILDLQLQLKNEGFAKNADLVMLECYNEAVRILKLQKEQIK